MIDLWFTNTKTSSTRFKKVSFVGSHVNVPAQLSHLYSITKILMTQCFRIRTFPYKNNAEINYQFAAIIPLQSLWEQRLVIDFLYLSQTYFLPFTNARSPTKICVYRQIKNELSSFSDWRKWVDRAFYNKLESDFYWSFWTEKLINDLLWYIPIQIPYSTLSHFIRYI